MVSTNQQAATIGQNLSKQAGGIKAPSSSFLDKLNPFNPNSPLYLFPGPSLTPKQKAQGPGNPLSPTDPNNPLFTPGQQKTIQQLPSAAASSLLPAFMTSIQFWKGLGLVLAGALILIFAAIEFRSMAGV